MKLVQVRNFYYLFEFKVFRHEEKETQFLQLTRGTFRRPQLVSPRRDEKSTTFLKTRISTLVRSLNLNYLFFFSNFKILSASGHDVIHVPDYISYLSFLLWHLWLSHPPRTRVNTCTQCVHLTNPCTKRKVLSLTKPKGILYKTKNDNIKKIPLQLYYNPIYWFIRFRFWNLFNLDYKKYVSFKI